MGGGHSRPRFKTKKQRIAELEKHLEDLQDEVKAVKEYIADIKKEK
jgi:predicted  nucleic acid-binding Zn-ribbon protein